MNDAFERHWRLLALAVAIAFLAAMTRHRRPDQGSPARRVSLAEIERIASDEPFLRYVGFSRGGHRFETDDGRAFLVPRGGLDLPELIPAGSGLSLFVTIRGGKIQKPDPMAIAAWAKRKGLEEPPDADPGPAESPPVERHDASAEPPLLVLVSDGDWTPYDLARLDAVLAAWLRDEGLVPADPAAPGPTLAYRPDESPGDLKSIVVRASHVPSSRLESLADRLGRKFPFLRSLDVGWAPQ